MRAKNVQKAGDLKNREAKKQADKKTGRQTKGGPKSKETKKHASKNAGGSKGSRQESRCAKKQVGKQQAIKGSGHPRFNFFIYIIFLTSPDL